jgi:NADPH2:quinone reductase
MRVTAARLTQHGMPLSVEETDLPDPGPGEVVVEMAFGGVNPVDRYAALGRLAPDAPVPRTLGGEGAGRLDGRRVLVRGHGLGTRRDGLWATAAVVPEGATIDVPDGLELEHAAAMGVAGVTAWRCVTEKAQVTADDRVLVLGASGGVGSMIVSLVRSIGATVWGQTGSEHKAQWVRDRGAERVVVADVGSLVGAARDLRPTVVFDALGDGYFGAGVQLLQPRGRLVIFGTSADASGEVPLQQLYRKGLTIHGYAGLIAGEEEMAAATRQAMEAARDGRLQVAIDRALRLTEVNEAFDLIAGRGVSGKLILDLQR